ncbi:MAG TPA: RDD family protein, partial [Gammaproteobacteria bacterium]|nr:RDD family protein [Gammaproteobacteria bacterium]
MSKSALQPAGDFPKAGFWKRMAAIFYDFMLCIALIMVVTMLYQQGILRMIYGSEALQEMAESRMLDIDPVLSTLLFFSVFAFFA